MPIEILQIQHNPLVSHWWETIGGEFDKEN